MAQYHDIPTRQRLPKMDNFEIARRSDNDQASFAPVHVKAHHLLGRHSGVQSRVQQSSDAQPRPSGAVSPWGGLRPTVTSPSAIHDAVISTDPEGGLQSVLPTTRYLLINLWYRISMTKVDGQVELPSEHHDFGGPPRQSFFETI